MFAVLLVFFRAHISSFKIAKSRPCLSGTLASFRLSNVRLRTEILNFRVGINYFARHFYEPLSYFDKL